MPKEIVLHVPPLRPPPHLPPQVRMVKTILHEVCKAKGRDVYRFTSHIPGADLDPANRPHIFPYIDLNLSTMGVTAGVPPVVPLPSATASAAAVVVISATTGPAVHQQYKVGGPLAPLSTNAQVASAAGD